MRRSVLPLPDEPVYPVVKFSKTGAKIVIKTPKALLEREIMRNGYIRELQLIIMKNNEQVYSKENE